MGEINNKKSKKKKKDKKDKKSKKDLELAKDFLFSLIDDEESISGEISVPPDERKRRHVCISCQVMPRSQSQSN